LGYLNRGNSELKPSPQTPPHYPPTRTNMSEALIQPVNDISMDDDDSSEEETVSTTEELQLHLNTKFGVGLHHPAGFVERTDSGTCHMLLLILAPKESGIALPNCNLVTRTGVARLLRDAFQLTVGAIYQPTPSTRAWTFPVGSDDANRLRAGVFRLAPNLGFVLFATYGAPTKKAWTFVAPVTENVNLSDLRNAVRALAMVKAADKPKRVTTHDDMFTEKALVRVTWEDLDLTEDAPKDVINIIRRCYVRTFRIPGSLTTFELRSLPPCSFCGFLSHFLDSCTYAASLATAPLLELTAPPNKVSTTTPVAGPAKAPREKAVKKAKGKKAKEDTPPRVSEKAKGKQKEVKAPPKAIEVFTTPNAKGEN